MQHEDTVRLLRECNSGVKMGIEALNEVIPHVKNEGFAELLDRVRDEHKILGDDTKDLLMEYREPDKEPNPIAKGMSWMKTNVMYLTSPNDATVADLMTDGCHMGIKSLSRYLNQYPAADERARVLTGRLIALEEEMAVSMRDYL